jgi:hypothetical protein
MLFIVLLMGPANLILILADTGVLPEAAAEATVALEWATIWGALYVG